VLFDALKMKFRELKLRKDPRCPVCSEHPTQSGLIDYDQFCGIDPQPESGMTGDDFEMTVDDLKRRLDDGQEITVLDVRTPQEYEIAKIEGSVLIPLQELQDRLGELDPADTIVAHCHHGMRSAKAVQLLRQMGFKRAINLAGGIDAWSEEIDPKVPRY
jgi:adenylyltransferase/sulfurtransferase